MTATSSEIWLVIASSSTEATMASVNHRSAAAGDPADGCPEVRCVTAGRGALRPTSTAVPAQPSANSRKPADHAQP